MKDRLILVCLCLLLVFSPVAIGWASNQADAASAIGQAEQRVNSCYQAAADAERNGANVTKLLLILDQSGTLLSNAQLAFQIGNFDSAYSLAIQSNTSLDGFESEANTLGDSAEKAGFTDFMVNIVGSAVGTIVVIVAGVLLWLYLKKRSLMPKRVLT